ncbi:hypothetical protein [Halopseudomonas salegens]|uniref:Uncharacterized protein n=1 Tax=Halopseudomonas salegens TaxID=1434072 RepID=A0A1H2E876_9GAMM|nr:hypothetical protein [Halopseudomonas salegens]SDT91386.1 hypothetical protein SAMN05216210_0448 [Halopseudomonas salegens]
MSKAARLFFNGLGILGVLLLGLFLFLNTFATAGNPLHEYRLKLVLAFLLVILLHGCYLVSDAASRKKYVWVALLVIAPVPVYWVYYIYHSVLVAQVRLARRNR